MTNVKTAISLEEPLFEQAEELARELSVSRSRLYALALEAFIRRHHEQQVLDRLDHAYADEPNAEETALGHGRRRHHRRLVAGEW
jgi:hypothetical protein